MGKHLGGTGASLVLRSPRTLGQTLDGGRVVGGASGWQVCPFQLWGTAGDPKALGDQDSVEGGSGLAWEQHRGQCQGFGWDRPKARAPLWNRTRDWPLPPRVPPTPHWQGTSQEGPAKHLPGASVHSGKQGSFLWGRLFQHKRGVEWEVQPWLPSPPLPSPLAQEPLPEPEGRMGPHSPGLLLSHFTCSWVPPPPDSSLFPATPLSSPLKTAGQSGGT